MLAGSEAYQAALIYYRSVKMAAEGGVANAGTVYKDLAQRFESSTRTTTSTNAVEA